MPGTRTTPPGLLLRANCRPLRVISGARSLRPGYCSRPITARSGSSPELVHSARATAPGRLPPAPGHLRSSFTPPGLLLRADCRPLRVISGARSLRPGYCSGPIAARSGSSPELVHSARAIAPGRLPPAPGHLRSSFTPPGPLLRADCRPLRVISGARSLRPGYCSGPIAARSGSSPELVHSARATAPGRLPPAPGHLRSSFTPPGLLLRADCRPLRVISGDRPRLYSVHSGSSPELVHSARAIAPGRLPPAPGHLRSRSLRPGYCSGPIATRSGSSPELVHSARATAPGRLPPAPGHLRSSFTPGSLPGPLLRGYCDLPPAPGHLRSSCSLSGPLLRPVSYPYSGLSVVDTSLSVIYPVLFYLISLGGHSSACPPSLSKGLPGITLCFSIRIHPSLTLLASALFPSRSSSPLRNPA